MEFALLREDLHEFDMSKQQSQNPKSVNESQICGICLIYVKDFRWKLIAVVKRIWNMWEKMENHFKTFIGRSELQNISFPQVAGWWKVQNRTENVGIHFATEYSNE